MRERKRQQGGANLILTIKGRTNIIHRKIKSKVTKGELSPKENSPTVASNDSFRALRGMRVLSKT